MVRKSYKSTWWDNVGRGVQGMGGNQDDSKSFFFTSFRDELNAKDMYGELKGFRDINEVVIRDIRGRKYGFVRFFKVKDARLLAEILDNIFIGDKKIFVKLLIFQRNLLSMIQMSVRSNKKA